MDEGKMTYDPPLKSGLDFKFSCVIDSGGAAHAKSVPVSRDARIREDQVAWGFIKSYIFEEGLEDDAEIIGKDGEGGQRHDYTFRVAGVGNILIEITSISESEDSQRVTNLQNQVQSIVRSRNEQYFVFLPHNTQPKTLRDLFANSIQLPSIDPPETNEEITELVIKLGARNQPFIRRLKYGNTQIHTFGGERLTLGEMVRLAVRKKEAKNYPGVSSKNIVLLIEDRAIGVKREEITALQGLLAYEHMGSIFKEIHIISLKSDYTGKDKEYEFMITPIKCARNKKCLYSVLHVLKQLERTPLPLKY